MNLDKKINVKNVFLLNEEGNFSASMDSKEMTLGEVITNREEMKRIIEHRKSYLNELDNFIEKESK